jgi:serine/threonine protein phosphatase PrpC
VRVSDSHEFIAPGEKRLAAVDIFGTTHRGKVRAANEDQFLVASLHKSMQVQQTSLDNLTMFARLRGSSAYLLVVADGVGGHGGGKLASGTAVATLAEHIGETIGCYYNYDVDQEHEFLSQLESAVQRSHQRVVDAHASTEGRPATTLTMVALMWPRAYVVHVGDSRVYYLRGGRLRQLTRDQTAYEALLDQGTIAEDGLQAPGIRSRLKNTLTSAIGAEFEPSIGLIDLQAGDVLLLCTDGLTKHVPDPDIASILGSAGGAEESCRRLLDLTMDRGASDNVTVVVGRFAAS